MSMKPMMYFRPLTFPLLLAAGVLATGTASAQTYSKTEVITYYDDVTKWVLGQTASVTCTTSVPASTACDGDVASATTYDSATALPWKTYAFGKLQQTLTYDTTSAVTTGQRGTLKTVSDGRDSGTYNTTITLTSWKRGIPQNISYPDGTTQSAVVNDNGWLTSVTDENGYKTCYGFDAMGRLASITYPSESQVGVCNTTTWAATTLTFAPVAATEYGIPAGHWKQTVSTGNGRQNTYYDAMWRPLVSERYDAGNVAATRSVSVTRYDADGHPVYQSYPLASLSSYATVTQGTWTTYDALDRVTRVEQDSELGVLATTTQYLTGFQTRITNPRGFATTTSYMAYDQPTTDWPMAVTHPEGAYTYVMRDAFGKPTQLTRRNADGSVKETRSYNYNVYQQLCKRIDPEAGSTLMGYDAAGNLAWSAAGVSNSTVCDLEGDTATILARKAIRTYDQRNRVSSLSFPDNRGNTTYDYAPDGLLNSIATIDSSNTVTTNYTYNKRRLPTNEQMLWNSINWNIGYGYNSNGHLASQSYPGSLTVTYLPNALGQPTQAGAYATGVSYFPNGAIKQFTYGNGIVHTLTQNTRGLPDTSCDSYGACGPSSVLNDGYDYDANGNVAAISDGLTINGIVGRGNRTMTYDGLDRLTRAQSRMFGTTTAGAAAYSYDVLDNLTRVTVNTTDLQPGRDHYYCYDTNWQLTNVKTGSCTGASVTGLDYDVQGNLENKNGTTYTFDYGNRLRTVDPAGTTEPTITYTYDGHGRRVRDLAGEARYSFYTLGGQLAFTGDSRANKNSNYIYLGGSLVATRELVQGTTGPYTVKYQHTDALGSPVAVTNASRTVIERSEYEPYGKVLVPAAPQDGPGYTGHVFDSATGLNYMQQRYYDPGIGRFLSVDPVTASGVNGSNFNRYWYANNNPYKFTDPDGRQGEFAALRGILVFAAADAATPDPSDAVAPAKAALYGSAIVGAAIGGAIGWAINQASESASEGDVGPHAPGDVPDDGVIVRGGQGDMPAPGTPFSGSQGGTVEEAGKGVPHGTIRPTTAGGIRANGGTVEVAPEPTRSGNINGQHVNVTEGGSSSSFGPPQPNPVPKPDRVQ